MVSAGGGVKQRRDVRGSCRREAAEEIGATLGKLRLFGIYTSFYEHKSDHVVIFTCDDFALTGRTDVEIERFDFFALTTCLTAIAGTRRRLQEYMNGRDVPVVGVW